MSIFNYKTPLWHQCVLKRPENIAPWNYYGIPAEFHSTTLSDFTNDGGVRQKIAKLLKKSPMVWAKGLNLLLSGRRGVGKSHLAAELVKEVMRYHDHWAHFIKFEDLVDLLSRTRFANRAEEDDLELLRRLRTFELVVIDGFGEVEANSVRALLLGFLRARTGAGDISTVLTTKLSPDALTEALGDAVVEEIEERFTMMPVIGRSFHGDRETSKLDEALGDDE